MTYRIRQWLNRTGALLLLALAAYAEKPSLTPEIAEHATGYMEWVLDAPFTADQRQRYGRILAEMWRGSQGSRETIAGMARIHRMLPQLDESQRNETHAASQKEFVRLLESATDDDSRWLLAIYRDARDGRPAPRSSAPLGRWTDGHISSIQYQNAYTGAPAPTNGNMFAYEFKADGTYSFTGLMQSVAYNCTTTLFSNEAGAYTVDGDSIALRPEKNPYKMTNNCAPSSNRESPGKLNARSYRFRTVVESGRRYLELRGQDGAVQKFGADR
ncbi:MAG TPA: hypothetical protein VHA53_05715 [Nitrolancea sp.]|nr:hypothetical protein [Nitrolancea sp.]